MAYGNKLPFDNQRYGDIVYNRGSQWDVLHAGTSGLFLKTQGINKPPIWSNINTQSPSYTSVLTFQNGQNNQAGYTTSSWTPNANRLIIVSVMLNNSAAVPTPTIAGNGITWSQVTDQEYDNVGGDRYRLTTFAGLTGSSSTAGAITVTIGVNCNECILIADEVFNADVTGTALSAIVQSKVGPANDPTGTLSMSIVFNNAITTGNSTYGVFATESTQVYTAGANYTKLSDQTSTPNPNRMATEYQINGNATVNMSWVSTNGGGDGGVAMEIKSGTAVATHNVLSATHGDTLSAAVIRGDLIVGNSTPAWSRKALGGSGTYIRSDGTDVQWSTIQSADLPVVSGLKIARVFEYDFTVDGGAISTINLRAVDGLTTLPNNFIIQNAEIDVITGLTAGAGGTGALTTGQGAGDLVTATSITGVPWSTTGQKGTSALIATSSTNIKTTAVRTPAFVIAVATVTAGKFRVMIEGWQSA